MRGTPVQGYEQSQQYDAIDINHHLMPTEEVDASLATGIFGLMAFLNVVVSVSLWVVTGESQITFATLQNAGASLMFILSMAVCGVELLMWPFSYIDSPVLAFVFTVWSNVTKWHLTTTYWLPLIFLFIAQFTEIDDLHMDSTIFFAIACALGGLGVFVAWVNLRSLYVHYETRFPGVLWDQWGIDITRMDAQSDGLADEEEDMLIDHPEED